MTHNGVIITEFIHYLNSTNARNNFTLSIIGNIYMFVCVIENRSDSSNDQQLTNGVE